MLDPQGVPISDEPSIRYALSGLISSHLTTKNADILLKFVLRLPIEFQIITLQQAVPKNLSLLHTKGVKEWMQVNKAVFLSD